MPRPTPSALPHRRRAVGGLVRRPELRPGHRRPPRTSSAIRQALIEANYKPVTIRWKLMIVRRFYEAARNAGLRPDNPAAGVKRAAHTSRHRGFQVPLRRGTGRIAGGDSRSRRRRRPPEGPAAAQPAHGRHDGAAGAAHHRSPSRQCRGPRPRRTITWSLLVRGKTRDRIAYLRPDTAT